MGLETNLIGFSALEDVGKGTGSHASFLNGPLAIHIPCKTKRMRLQLGHGQGRAMASTTGDLPEDDGCLAIWLVQNQGWELRHDFFTR